VLVEGWARDFFLGRYYRFAIRDTGAITVRIARGFSPNATLSGFFLDLPGYDLWKPTPAVAAAVQHWPRGVAPLKQHYDKIVAGALESGEAYFELLRSGELYGLASALKGFLAQPHTRAEIRCAWWLRWQCERLLGRWWQAEAAQRCFLRELVSSERAKKDKVGALMKMADDETNKGRSRYAVAALALAIQLMEPGGSRYRDALRKLAFLYTRLGMTSEAEAVLQRLTSFAVSDESRADALYSLALIQRSVSEDAKALDSLRKVSRRYGRLPEGSLARGLLRMLRLRKSPRRLYLHVEN